MSTPPEPEPKTEPERHYRIDALAAALPIVEAPDFEAGRWQDSERRGDSFESGIMTAIARRATELGVDLQATPSGTDSSRG